MRVGVGVDPAEDRPAGVGCRFVLHVSLRSFRARLDRADGTLTGRDRMRLFGSAVSLHAPIRSCGGLGSPRGPHLMVSTSMVYGCIIDVFNTENISVRNVRIAAVSLVIKTVRSVVGARRR